MKRQRFFPKQVAARPEWFLNFANMLEELAAALGLVAADVTRVSNEARYCAYVCGDWLQAVRDLGPAGTAAVEILFSGPGGAAMVLPTFVPPALPAGVTAVASGALDRIFAYIKVIKAMPHYTEAMGLQLGIVGAEDTVVHDLPTFSLKVERGGGCECVRIPFRTYGHAGVVVWSRRNNGPWEMLGIDLASPYLDERPLLDPTKPEVREYRLQFYEGSSPVGGFTEIQTVTVSP